MTVTMETCSYCHGRGEAERFEQSIGGSWRPMGPGAFDGLAPHAIAELQEAALRIAPNVFRWSVCRCPRCDGDGEYVIEHVTCKIF